MSNYRYGMASKLVEQMRGTNGEAFTARIAALGRKQLPGGSNALQDKLGQIFGSKANFDQMMQRAEWEARMKASDLAATGPTTHLNDAAAGVDLPDAALGAVGSNFASSAHLAQSAVQRLIGRMARVATRTATAQDLLPTMQTSGQPAIDALLATFKNPPPMMGMGATTMAPAVAGAAGAQMAPRP